MKWIDVGTERYATVRLSERELEVLLIALNRSNNELNRDSKVTGAAPVAENEAEELFAALTETRRSVGSAQ